MCHERPLEDPDLPGAKRLHPNKKEEFDAGDDLDARWAAMSPVVSLEDDGGGCDLEQRWNQLPLSAPTVNANIE